jgi:cytochrome c peroxidase
VRVELKSLLLALALIALPMGAPGERLYRIPEPGSYALPPIDRVEERTLLDAQGKPAHLLGLGEGELAVVSFMYRACTDAAGCPLALGVLQQLDRRLATRGERRVRLVSVSFDPQRDTPEALAHMQHHMAPRGEWRFLVPPDAAALDAVLRDFGQDALRLVDAEGADTGVIRHVLRVYLVDSERRVRNIYSSGFLDPELLDADIRTLLMEGAAKGE